MGARAVSRQHASLHDPQYEARLQQALDGLHNKTYRSVSEAARATGANRNTLQGRWLGKHRPRSEAYQERRLLNSSQERALLDWMDTAALQGQPFGAAGVRSAAFDMTGVTPGKNWVYRFNLRHDDELLSSKATGLDPTRGKNFNRPTVTHFFEMLADLEKEYGTIPPQQIWNMDEKGLQLGGGRKAGRTKFFFFRNRKTRYKIRSDNLELVTILESINAAGDVADTTFILTKGPFPDIRGTDHVGSVGVSEAGWTDRQHFADYIADVWLPAAKSHVVDITKPIVFLLDGHDSHECLEVKAVIYLNAGPYIIIVICFPSKCTHKLQPLDVAVFNHAQTAWKARCDYLTNRGVKVNRYNVIPEYMALRPQFMTKKLIQHAFSATGIYPLNPDVFTEEDYAPSHSFSIKTHAPPSYPDEIPSSDPAIPSDDDIQMGIVDEDRSDDDDDSDYVYTEPDSDWDLSDEEVDCDVVVGEGNVELAEAAFTFGFGWYTTVPRANTDGDGATSWTDDLWDQDSASSTGSNAEDGSGTDTSRESLGSLSDEEFDMIVIEPDVQTGLRWCHKTAASYNVDDWLVGCRLETVLGAYNDSDGDKNLSPIDHRRDGTPEPDPPSRALSPPLSPARTRSVVRRMLSVMTTRVPPLTRSKLEALPREELIKHALLLQSHNHGLTTLLQRSDALRHTAEAHCTLALRQLDEEKERVVKLSQKAARGTSKIKARMIVGPGLKEHFTVEQREAKEKEQETAEKEREKVIETAERSKRIVEAAASRIFDKSLNAYTKKEDLVGLARALQLSEEGTNPQLKKRIEDHLREHPTLEGNQRFKALFQCFARSRTTRSTEDTPMD